ncbi:MAG: hypothetical protein ABI091_21710 [Ferruginibacter sp.]
MKSIFANKSNRLPLLLIAAGLLLAFTKPVYSLISPVNLDVNIMQAPVVMPSIYKVYANEDALGGKYSLFKMTLTNNSNHAAENVEVAYEVTNYIQNMVCQKIPKILPGQTVVVNCYPNFPDKIVEKTTSSKETVNITIKGSNLKTIENSFPIQIKGRNEFVYTYIPVDEIRTAAESFDNKELLSCFVTPEDPIIKYLTQKIQEKILKGEAASVEGKDEEAVRFMMGVYEATLRSHMVYSGTSGVPEKLGDASSIVQSIRLPREVVTGKTGLCIELSLLYASVMMNAGLDPMVYLVPGHAYPGFKINGNFYAIEATGINGEGLGGIATGQQAYQTGMKNLKTWYDHMMVGDPAYTYLDVRQAIKEGALAMELKDDNFLRQKIDEIAQSFDGSNIPQKVNTVANNGGGGNDGGGNGGGNDGGGGGNTRSIPSGYKGYSGVVNFAYPGTWRQQPRTQYTMSNCVQTFGNSNNTMDVEVYNFPGASSPEQAMKAIQQHVRTVGANMGMQVQYQPAGQADGFTLYSGVTGNQNVSINWVAGFKNTGNGIAGIAVGAESHVNGKATAEKIFNTLQ